MSSEEGLHLPVTRFRVNQLDSILLDDEISRLFKDWINTFLSLIDVRSTRPGQNSQYILGTTEV